MKCVTVPGVLVTDRATVRMGRLQVCGVLEWEQSVGWEHQRSERESEG